MKKILLFLLTGAVLLSLTACGGAPSEEKIKAALENGTLTVEDAKAKGWIDDAWIETNFEQVEAKTKIYLFAPFETTYLDGSSASSSIINGKVCLVFFDTTQEETMSKLTPYNEAYDAMKEAGVPVIGIITNPVPEAARDKLQEMKFPIIVYNDEMKTSLEAYGSIIDTDVTAVFTKDGGLYTAWYSQSTADDLLETARGLAHEE